MSLTNSLLATFGAGTLALTGVAADTNADNPDTSTDMSLEAFSSFISYHNSGLVIERAISSSQEYPSTYGGRGSMALDDRDYGLYEFYIYSTNSRGVTSGSASTAQYATIRYSSVPQGAAGTGHCYWINNTPRKSLLSDMTCLLQAGPGARSARDISTDEVIPERETRNIEIDSSQFDPVAVNSTKSNDYIWSTFVSEYGEVCLNGTSQANSDYAVTACAEPDDVREHGLSVLFKSGDGGHERAYYMPSAQDTKARGIGSLADGEIVVMDERPGEAMARSSNSHTFEMTSDSGQTFEFLKFDADQYPHANKK